VRRQSEWSQQAQRGDEAKHEPDQDPRVAAALEQAPDLRSVKKMIFFVEIQEYVGFTEEDAEALRGCREVVKPHFEEIVNAFYGALSLNQRTRQVFEGPEQVERLRKSLHRWLEQVFDGPYDERYFEQRLRIGKVHVNVGLLPHFMFGAMNIIRRNIIDIITRDEGLGDRKFACSSAVEKILDIELTIMLQSYWDTMMELKLQVPVALASGLAHEIRNPLNAINLNMTLLERRVRQHSEEASAEAGPVLEVMRSEIRRIRGLTSDIMDFAKPIDISPSWHNIQQFLNEQVAMHGPTFEASHLGFEGRVEGDELMWCDLDRLRQVFVNLITNAVESMNAGGKITLLFQSDTRRTRIFLSDTGEGMAPGTQYKVFDLFYTTKAQGTGLGLPIVRKIIEAHGGWIEVQSRQGIGTTFIVTLPRPGVSLEVGATRALDAEEEQ
jgi:signal transduction histidine kinase